MMPIPSSKSLRRSRRNAEGPESPADKTKEELYYFSKRSTTTKTTTSSSAATDAAIVTTTVAPHHHYQDNDGPIAQAEATTATEPDEISTTTTTTSTTTGSESPQTQASHPEPFVPIEPHSHNDTVHPHKNPLDDIPTRAPYFTPSPASIPSSNHSSSQCSNMTTLDRLTCETRNLMLSYPLSSVLLLFGFFWCLFYRCCGTPRPAPPRGEYRVIHMNDDVFGDDYSDNELSDDDDDGYESWGSKRAIEMSQVIGNDTNGISLAEMNG